MLRIPHYMKNRLTHGDKVFSPITGRTVLPETLFSYFCYSFLLETEYTPGSSERDQVN
jgi:hypothetical protein